MGHTARNSPMGLTALTAPLLPLLVLVLAHASLSDRYEEVSILEGSVLGPGPHYWGLGAQQTKARPVKRYLGIDIPDYVTVRSRERPGQYREEILKRMQERG